MIFIFHFYWPSSSEKETSFAAHSPTKVWGAPHVDGHGASGGQSFLEGVCSGFFVQVVFLGWDQGKRHNSGFFLY